MNKVFKTVLPMALVSASLFAVPVANAQPVQDINHTINQVQELSHNVINDFHSHVNNNKTFINIDENGNNHNVEIPFLIDEHHKNLINNVTIPNVEITIKDSRDVQHEAQVEHDRKVAAEYNARVQQVERAQQAERVAVAAPVSNNSVWSKLANCESGGNASINTGNGYYGMYQFSKPTWDSVGGAQYAAYPHQASAEQQTHMAQKLQAQSGWGQWPACTSQMGLR